MTNSSQPQPALTDASLGLENEKSPVRTLDRLPAPLEAVLCTAELTRRPSRPPDHAAECRALALLAQALADSPESILQTVADTMLSVFAIGTAGVSVLAEDGRRLVSPAVAGAWRSHVGASAPRDSSPCGDVLDSGCAMLFRRNERRYHYFLEATPPAEECLLVPFFIAGKATGTLWAITHDDRRKFDYEDVRLLQSLAAFAAAAYRSVRGLDTAHGLAQEAGRSAEEKERLNSELRQSEAFSSSILRSSPDCIKVLDLGGNLLSLQSGCQQLPKADIEFLLNKSWIDFWKGEDRHSAQMAINRAAAGGQGGFTGVFSTLAGEVKRWDVTISPIRGTDGKVERLLAVSRDVTGQKLADEVLRQSEARFRALVTASSDLMCRMSPDWGEMRQVYDKNLVLNKQATDTGWLERYVHRDDQPRLLALVAEAIRTKSLFEMEHRVRRADGSWGWMLSRAVPLLEADGEIIEWFGAGTDVTARKRAEQAMHESDERYRSLFDSIDEGFAIIEMVLDEAEKPVDYRFLQVNPSFEIQSGLHGATGRLVSELIPDLEASWLEFYGQVALTGTPMRIVSEVRSMDRWLDIYAARLGPPDGRQVAVVFNNITQRVKSDKALRDSEERFRALFDRGPVAMYACDADGVIQEFNRNAVLMWGAEPVRGDANLRFWQSFRLYFADGRPMARHQTPVSVVLRGEEPPEHGADVIIERPDGSRVAVVSNPVALRNAEGEITGAINCVYDVTERSRLERKTIEQAQALADLDRRKDEFLAMLSHELRNPLAPLSNAAQLLRLQKIEDPVQRQAHATIERQVGQLKHLVDDLLEVSRINTGSVRLRREQVSVNDIVLRAVETAQPLMTQRRHELRLALPPEPVYLYADAARLEQVLVNLLTNAAKYTDEGGCIRLDIETENQANGAEAALRVRDNGIGIAPELLPRVFDLFTQAERSLDRSQGGLGIGLSLVRRLVELHGGRVEAFSQPGHGSEFVVRLPVMTAAVVPSLPAVPLAPKPATASRKILVVDDNVDSVRSLAQLLTLFGHDVRTACDGHAAMRAAEAMRPDVMLLDIGLPGLTGLEVAEKIRGDPALANTVLVALTGYGRDADRQLSQDAGFDHHLVKPADFAEVQQILASLTAPAAT